MKKKGLKNDFTAYKKIRSPYFYLYCLIFQASSYNFNVFYAKSTKGYSGLKPSEITIGILVTLHQ